MTTFSNTLAFRDFVKDDNVDYAITKTTFVGKGGFNIAYDLNTITPKNFLISESGMSWTNGTLSFTTPLDKIGALATGLPAVVEPPNTNTLKLNNTLLIEDPAYSTITATLNTDSSTAHLDLTDGTNSVQLSSTEISIQDNIDDHQTHLDNQNVVCSANGNEVVMSNGTGTYPLGVQVKGIPCIPQKNIFLNGNEYFDDTSIRDIEHTIVATMVSNNPANYFVENYTNLFPSNEVVNVFEFFGGTGQLYAGCQSGNLYYYNGSWNLARQFNGQIRDMKTNTWSSSYMTIVGDFTGENMSGQTLNYIACLDTGNNVNVVYLNNVNLGFNNSAYTICNSPTNSYYQFIGGSFTYDGNNAQQLNRLAILDYSNGYNTPACHSIDDNYSGGCGFDGVIRCLAVANSGANQLLAVGDFYNISFNNTGSYVATFPAQYAVVWNFQGSNCYQSDSSTATSTVGNSYNSFTNPPSFCIYDNDQARFVIGGNFTADTYNYLVDFVYYQPNILAQEFGVPTSPVVSMGYNAPNNQFSYSTSANEVYLNNVLVGTSFGGNIVASYWNNNQGFWYFSYSANNTQAYYNYYSNATWAKLTLASPINWFGTNGYAGIQLNATGAMVNLNWDVVNQHYWTGYNYNVSPFF